MANFTASSFSQARDGANAQASSDNLSSPQDIDKEVWDHLKQAIASSSGFQRWQIELSSEEQSHEFNLERRVSKYLRETLETLAY